MPVTLLLMYKFMTTYRQTDWASPAMFPFLAKDKVAVLLSVLEAFPEE